MSDWIEKDVIEITVQKEVPACPDCKQELNWLDMHNETDSCECGTWSESYSGVMHFKPFEKKKKGTK